MSDKEFEPVDLGKVLSDDEPHIDVKEQTPIENPVEQVAETAALEAPQDAPTEPETVQPEPQPADDAGKPWTYHMAMDEKAKRKQFEDENRQLQARLQALEYDQRQRQAQKPVEAPDVLVDPNGYTQHIQGQIVQQFSPVVQQLQRQVAEMQHTPDVVKDAEAWMNTLAPHQRGALIQQCNATGNPYSELVSVFRRDEAAQALTDPAQLEAFKAWQAEQVKQPSQPAPSAQTQPSTQTPQFMPSVAGKPSVTSRSGPTWAGPQPLEAILPE
jgi:hypothetical protein